MTPVVYTDPVPSREKESADPMARWVREVRHKAGMTQDEFAAAIRVHRQTVTAYEGGDFPKGLRAAVELIMRKFPNAPRPPNMSSHDGATQNHTPAQIPQATAAQQVLEVEPSAVQVTVQVTKPANIWGLMTAIAGWAKSIGAPNPIEDSEFHAAVSSAWNEYEKRSKALAKR